MNKLEFQLYDQIEDNYIVSESGSEKEYNTNVGEFIIHAFGRCEDGKSVYAKIINFTPYFYILIPLEYQDREELFLKNLLKNLLTFIKSKDNKNVFYKYKNTLLDIKLIKLKRAEGFNHDKEYYFGRLIFNNSEGMKKYKYYLENNNLSFNEFKNITFKLYEANLSPMLRCFHIKNISGCSWIEVNKYKLIEDEEKESYCDIEINVNWNNLIAIKKTFNAPFRICSFDIECYSGDGSFPLGKRKENPIIQIGATYTYIGESQPYRQYIGCLQETDEMNDIIVESYNTEAQLIKGFIYELINNDCDIITGYNIFWFDEKYIYERCKYILDIEDEISLISKLKNYNCKFKELRLASSALGENLLRLFDTPGRVHIDLMKDVQKTYSLSSYTLNNVASHFIKGDLIDFKILSDYECELECKTVQDVQIGDFIKLELTKGFISDDIGNKYLVKKVYDNKIVICGNETLEEELIISKKLGVINWSQSKDDIEPADIFRLFKGNSQDRAIVAKYCIKDCKLVNLLINKLEIVTKNIEMANVCYVPLSFLFMRGQGIKLFSLTLKEYRTYGYAFPVIKLNKLYKCLNINCNHEFYNVWNCPKCDSKKKEEIELESSNYEGALVFDPIPQVEYEALVTKDYLSLYPSSIMHKNMSHETIVEDSQYDNLPNIKYYNANYKESDGSIKYCRFAQIDDKLGVIPSILNNLLKERKLIKKQMKEEKDPFKYKILDAKQFAVKITANSLYGQLGAATSAICKKEIAACTTSTGKEMLLLAKKYDEELLPWIINGLKYFYTNNELDKVNLLLDSELKFRSNTDFIDKLKNYISNDIQNLTFQPVVRYGDSVISKTPLLLRLNYKTIYIDTIDNIISKQSSWNHNYKTYLTTLCNNKLFPWNKKDDLTKKLLEDNIISNEKEYAYPNKILEVWTEKGWTKITNVMRHKLHPSKKLYRITTYSGSVVVTSDHSLLKTESNNEPVAATPEEVKINDTLLHSMPLPDYYNKNYIFEKQFFTSELLAMTYYYNAVMNNYIMEVDYDSKTNEYIISPTHTNDYRIRKKELYNKTYNDYVYDLTTENHHFHAGVGSIIVHNTDSIFSCYRFREDTKHVKSDKALKLWKKIVNFAFELLEPFFDEKNKKEFTSIFNKYYSIDKINELKIPIIPVNNDNMTLFVKEYMEENFIPWFWTLTELVEKNQTNMFDIKLIQWAESILNKYNIKANNLYEERKKYILDPIMVEINKIFKDKYDIPYIDTLNNFIKKLDKCNEKSFNFADEIEIDNNNLEKKCKTLFEKTIKDKWTHSSAKTELKKTIKDFLLEINKNDKTNIDKYISEFIDIDKNIDSVNNKIKSLNLNITITEEELISQVNKFIEKHKKNGGKKELVTIIEEFIQKELLLNFNLYKNNHYNKVINFINNIMRKIDSSDNTYNYYWIQPRLNFNNKEKELCIDIYKGGKSIIDKRTLDYSMKMGEISGELIKSHLPYPHDCEYEKTYWPFAIIKKKKYFGYKYENDINYCKKDFMGIVLKRRDNAPIVKEICGGIIDLLINKKDPIGAKQFTIQSIEDIFNGKYDIKYFLQSRSLKLKESYKDWRRIAHVFLADKISNRSADSVPQSGDRIQFAVVKVESTGKKLLQGEIIETPEFIKQNKLEIDYLFYLTNQIMNPAVQFLELVDKNAIEIFNNFINKYSHKKNNSEKIIKEKNVKKIIKNDLVKKQSPILLNTKIKKFIKEMKNVLI